MNQEVIHKLLKAAKGVVNMFPDDMSNSKPDTHWGWNENSIQLVTSLRNSIQEYESIPVDYELEAEKEVERDKFDIDVVLTDCVVGIVGSPSVWRIYVDTQTVDCQVTNFVKVIGDKQLFARIKSLQYKKNK